ncbi:MAG: dTDP-4-dehydrorhamnose 3,5-epimerase family protein [Anaerolineales bacterium]|nr:dTDP-4-dehydrorhamnose 3,5-epimerase family protein [Anaerolineales bacterium]
MTSPLPISDMHSFALHAAPEGVVLLREVDHVLRRFGELALHTLAPGDAGGYHLRAEADRVIFPLDGECSLRLLDLRPQSPSYGVHAVFALQAAAPQGVLVPFGVACSLAADSAARVLWLSTHSQPHAGDRPASAEELQRFLPAA